MIYANNLFSMCTSTQFALYHILSGAAITLFPLLSIAVNGFFSLLHSQIHGLPQCATPLRYLSVWMKLSWAPHIALRMP